jgi:integrase
MARRKNGRRDNGDGSLYPRKNRAGKVIGWVGAYGVREPSESGETTKKRKTVYAKTKEDAKALLAEAISAAKAPLEPARRADQAENPAQLVPEYLSSWLCESEHSLKVSAYRRYELSVRCHLSPAFADVPLDRLSPTHIQSLYQEKLRDGLSPRSVIHLHEALRRALNRAVMLGLISRNPCDGVQPPRARKTAMQPLDRQQAIRFLEAVRETKHEALFTLAITTGMRQGELLGLRWKDIDLDAASWKDIDLDAAIIRVSRSYVSWHSRGHGFTFVEPKSAGSRRVVALTPAASQSLHRHERLAKASGLHGLDCPVFSSESGTPLSPPNVIARHFKPILERTGLPDIRFHDLRHTCATLLLGQDVHPKIVQELLGHASIQLTLDTYSHYLPDMQEKAVDAMQSALQTPFQNEPPEV